MPITVADIAGASAATTAVLGALIARDKSGNGTHVDISLFEAVLPWIFVNRRASLAPPVTQMAQGSDGQSLESVLGSHFERVGQAIDEVGTVATRTTLVERDLQGAFGRVGLVRFNPFEDTGGNQSFALALLDGRGDGFVISSLHARAGTRVYAKAVAGGTSEAALSAEEAEALRQALAKSGPGMAGATGAPG